jgi:rod shape-determining protein MreC
MLDTSISRHRPLALLAGLILAQVLLLAFQIKRDHEVRLIRYWTVEALMPFERGGTWSFSKVGGVWDEYIGLRGTRAENARLHARVDQLQILNRQLESEAAEAQRFSALLGFREAYEKAPMIAAQVIGASSDTSSNTLFVNRGQHDRVRTNMPVITPEGIVGKIVEVFPATAQVLLISDRDSGVGALLEDSRTHGVVKGSGDPEPRLDYVVNDEKVHTGEVILTSGEDRIFPKGLLIGSVSSANPGNPFQAIRVRTAARLDRLEDVLILLSQQELVPKKTAEAGGAKENQSNSQGVAHPVTPPPAAERVLKNPARSSAEKPAAPSSEHPTSSAPPQAPPASHE